MRTDGDRNRLSERRHSADVRTRKRRFTGAISTDQAALAAALGHHSRQRGPPRRSHPSIERQFAERHHPRGSRRDVACGDENPECDRKVIGRSEFGKVGGCEVHGHTTREPVTRHQDGRLHPFPCLADGGIGKADDDKTLLTAAEMWASTRTDRGSTPTNAAEVIEANMAGTV